MKKKLLLFLSLFLSISGFYVYAQNHKDLKTPLVTYKNNVNLPLSADEKELICGNFNNDSKEKNSNDQSKIFIWPPEEK